MAAGEAPPKRHCPSCGSDQMFEGKAMSAKVVINEVVLLRMCVGCHFSWPAMDLTNRDFDDALTYAERLNSLTAAGIAVGEQVLDEIVDREERQMGLAVSFGQRFGREALA